MRYTRWIWLIIFPLALALSAGQIETPLGGGEAAQAAPAANGGVWQQLNTPSLPGNLDGHSLVVINNDVYLFGGFGPTTSREDLPWRNNLYVHSGTDLSTGWRKINLPEPQPPGRAFHAAAAVDGKMVIHGGLNGGATPLGDTWVFDPQTMTWSQKTPPTAPPDLAYHKAVATGGKMYLVGGTDSGGGPSDELWAYDSTANSWEQKESYPGPYGGTYGAAVFATGSGVMVGGTTGDTYYVYNPTSGWEAKTTTGFPNRESPGTAQVGATGYIFGGRDTATGEYRTESWKADLSGGTTIWEPLPPDMPNTTADICLIPEPYSPTVALPWDYDLLITPEQALEPAVLLYGRSWAYEPGSHTPILGDAATWLFWPDRAPAGALAGITVWPQDAVVDAGQQRLFNASGHDAAGYYVPITPTWEATGGSISAVGRYTAGDLPGNYTVRATHEMFAGQVQVTVSGTVTCPDLAAGVSWSHTFAVAGAYPYHDRASPDHTGTVVVNPTTTGQTCSLTTGLNPGPSNTTYDVSITAAGFDPPTVTIGLGDTVRWTNHDTVPHAVDGGESRRYTVYLPLVLRTSPAH